MEKEETAAKCSFLSALNKLQGIIEPVSKDSTNKHFGNKYASLTAVNEAVMGLVTAGGFTIMSGGVDIGGKPYLRTILAHVVGYSVSFDYPIVSDGNPQHTASSISYARRYALCSLLNLSVEDDDGNAAAQPAKTAARVTPAVETVFGKNAEAKPAPSTTGAISSPQAKRFYAIAKSGGKSDDEIKAYMKEYCGVERTEFIPRDKYEAACLWAGEKPAEVPF